jgi:hypothetical protein
MIADVNNREQRTLHLHPSFAPDLVARRMPKIIDITA